MSRSFKRHQSAHLNDRSWALEASLAAPRPQSFSTPLARDLFAFGAENAIEQASQFQARPLLSREEAERRRRASLADELRTEGRVHVNIRPQSHE